MSRFTGKVAVVTGAGSGIAQATARRFGSEEATVACLDIDEGRRAEDCSRDRRSRRERVGVPLQRRRSGKRQERGRRGRVEPGQAQCALQHRGGRELREHDRVAVRRVAARDRGQPHRHLPDVPSRASAHPRERRQHRQHRVERRAPGSRVLCGLLRVEGRRRPAHSRAGDRVLEEGHPRECGGARRCRHAVVPGVHDAGRRRHVVHGEDDGAARHGRTRQTSRRCSPTSRPTKRAT